MSIAVDRATSYFRIAVSIGGVKKTFTFKSGGEITIPVNNIATPSGGYQTGLFDETPCTGIIEMDYELAQQLADWFSTSGGTMNIGSCVYSSVNSENAGKDSTGNRRGRLDYYFQSCVVKECPRPTRSDIGALGELNITFSLCGFDRMETVVE